MYILDHVDRLKVGMQTEAGLVSSTVTDDLLSPNV